MNRLPRKKLRAVFGPARSPPADQSEERAGRGGGEESKGPEKERGIREEKKMGDKKGRKKHQWHVDCF